jgi:ubiquinone/menaquinone biosynthesis C-methylase UbiE
VGQQVDFSANASIYDRRHGAELQADVANRLAQYAGLTPGRRILDIGAGTGRVAIPFARLGYETVAFDSSVAMLHELQRKASETPVHLVVGTGERLPFANECFDAVIVARVLYLIADWRAALEQAHDVLKHGGSLFHEWGNGDADEEWVQIREKARRLFEQA